MKRFTLLFSAAIALAALCQEGQEDTPPAPPSRRTVLTVDENGKLNAPGIATVEDVATNITQLVVAEEASRVAVETAQAVTNDIEAIVSSIMDSNTVIYRSGYTDSFSAAIALPPGTKLRISQFTVDQSNPTKVIAYISYVSDEDVGAIDPEVYCCSNLAEYNNRNDNNFPKVDGANVVRLENTIHAVPKEIGEGEDKIVYSVEYNIRVTVDNVDPVRRFFWIKLSPDTVSGDGMAIDLPNGVTGGHSGSVVWGDRILTFVGGVLREVR